ncbi:hypothetical protein [Streptomyces sp. bgisy091]|uniref:hypothetical protein n=1 Tax=Streptomyces sp. bgisy091 TaxID=3413778 RepID=UPI003D7300E7
MNLAPGSILNLTTAAPGWTVSIKPYLETPNGLTAQTCPIVAWAVFVDHVMGDGSAVTTITPVFIHDGTTAIPFDLDPEFSEAEYEINPPPGSDR